MYEALISYVRNHSVTPLTEIDIEAIKDFFIPKKIRKRQYFLQEGDVCKHAAFMVKGAMRHYTIDDKGVEHIVRLSIENWWVLDRESYTMLSPSAYNIDAWEDCDVLLVTRPNMLTLSSIPAIKEMREKIFENYVIASQKRLSSISLSAEERYADLIKNNPEFLQRFPLHIIASYLGVSRETLSRIRGHAVKK